MNIQTSHLFAIEDPEVRVIASNGHVRPWREIRAEVLERALRTSHFNVREASAKLGVGRTTFYRWLSDQGS